MKHRDPLDTQEIERTRAKQVADARNSRDTEASDLKWLMSSRRGRRIVWRLLEHAAVFRPSFNTNAMSMAFAEGNKNYGFRILAAVHTVAPELYPTMMKENTDEPTTNDGTGNNQ